MWLAAYACISAYYRSLDAPNRKGFIAWCNYCDSWSGLISTPLSIALGFFMTQVFSRWWGMWMTCIGWAEPLAYKLVVLTGIVPFEGGKEEAHATSWTLFRWVQASHALTFVDYASAYKDVASMRESLVERGILTSQELKLIEQQGERAPYDLPYVWAFDFLNRLELKYGKREETGVSFLFSLTGARDEILKQRLCDANLRGYDYIPIPLPYLQILAFAVYSYFTVAMFGRQYVVSEDRSDPVIAKYHMAAARDYYVPVLTVVELIFYTGWLKTMALLFDPLSNSGCGYNIPEIEEGVMGRAITIFQAVLEGQVAPLDTTMHGYEPAFQSTQHKKPETDARKGGIVI